MNWTGLVVGGVIALFICMQLLMWIRAKRTVGQTAPDTSSVDGPAVTQPRRLYYFYSEHCGPCRAVKPVVEKLRLAHSNLIPVDVTRNVELTRQFGIAGTPSFILVESGSIREVLIGGQSEKKLKGLLAS